MGRPKHVSRSAGAGRLEVRSTALANYAFWHLSTGVAPFYRNLLATPIAPNSPAPRPTARPGQPATLAHGMARCRRQYYLSKFFSDWTTCTIPGNPLIAFREVKNFVRARNRRQAANCALNMSAFSVQKRPLSAIDVQNRLGNMSDPPRKYLKYRQHRFERHGTGHQLLKDWTWTTDDDN
jgi:hypothetical protein